MRILILLSIDSVKNVLNCWIIVWNLMEPHLIHLRTVWYVFHEPKQPSVVREMEPHLIHLWTVWYVFHERSRWGSKHTTFDHFRRFRWGSKHTTFGHLEFDRWLYFELSGMIKSQHTWLRHREILRFGIQEIKVRIWAQIGPCLKVRIVLCEKNRHY